MAKIISPHLVIVAKVLSAHLVIVAKVLSTHLAMMRTLSFVPLHHQLQVMLSKTHCKRWTLLLSWLVAASTLAVALESSTARKASRKA